MIQYPYWIMHGNPKRGTGILNNELYIGKLVCNRLKDPDTGKRVSRLNPKTDWVVNDVPHLCIVDQNLWDAVKTRQDQMALIRIDYLIVLIGSFGAGSKPTRSVVSWA